MKPDLITLETAAQQLGLPLSSPQAQLLLAYRDMIAKWNKVYNLTSLRDPSQMLSHHIIDSLAAAPPLQKHLSQAGLANCRLIDVGSGGGLPGVVLATVIEGLDVTCVDTVGKKAAFVQQAANELGLKNLRGVHARVEDMQAAPFDVITSRAFASLLDFVQLTRMHLKKGGIWMALKGKLPDDEIAALPTDVDVFHVEQLKVPGLDAERCIVWMKLK
ncbi:16S rRNA (guanine(527)-N(7))-methyltransferase RsmG [Variovorax sp. PCZ-1]|uniref:16S rRNA (guanine(527)-N(7))-methyltransferase RsmG n=1 Tax=Variovorax sp. PCZ-1 TaxID=2835533 RepID=UPI0020BE8737|nr:16S rRNA (guanine(527)-N(7))-methyltransferase RsmG [Variovorax sp. PCZ-1]